jgi:hypothetical protein
MGEYQGGDAVAGDAKTCTKCGNRQTTGDFCEKCGTRLPLEETAPPAPDATATASQTADAQPAPPPYQQQAQPRYVTVRIPIAFGRLFDTSLQGFVTRESARPLFVTILALLGVYWLFALIFGIVAAVKIGGYWCIGIFSSLILVSLMIVWTRMLMELATTVSNWREDMDKAAQTAAVEPGAPKTNK